MGKAPLARLSFPTSRFLGAMGNVAAEQNFLSLDCFMDQTNNDKAIRRMVITVLQPVMFLCLFFFIWILAKLIKRKNTQ